MLKKVHPIVNSLLWVLRIAVGGLFIFSGLVKANDPSGLAYKMGEFFEAWATKDLFLPELMQWFNEYALPFAMIMIVLEIVAGVALIIGYRFAFFSWLIFLLTAFFTFLTAYVLFSGNIKACGCFGDCIALTPQQTFTKDIILLVLISILLVFRKNISALFIPRLGNLIMIGVFILSIFIQTYVLKNLPFIDCLPYKIGNNIKEQMTAGADYKAAAYESVLIYENIQSGEKKEFDIDHIPWQDSLTWKYDTTLTSLISEAKNEPKIKDFALSDYSGNNVTETILNYPGDVYIVFIKDVKTANVQKIEHLQKLINSCRTPDNNVPIIAVSASDNVAVDEFKQKHTLPIDFYQIDGTVCKTAMRSNPGILLLNSGTIMGKWSYNNMPNSVSMRYKNPQNNPPLFKEVQRDTINLELPKNTGHF